MPSQENGGIKQLKLRMPMELYQQLVKDSAEHHEPPATRARHILLDALMHVPLNEHDFKEIEKLKRNNWAKINGETK